MRICIAASAGGHLRQMLNTSPAWERRDLFFVTTSEAVRGQLEQIGPVYVVPDANRQHPLKALLVLVRCVQIMIRERPAVVYSTGALVGCVLCYIGKLMGARIIWLDSLANVTRLSLSGRLIRPFADLFLVQWPELAERYRGAEYVGEVL